MQETFRDVVFMLALAFAGEAVIEFLVSPLLDIIGVRNRASRTFAFNCLSAVFGILLALGYSVSIAAVFRAEVVNPDVDVVLTGLLIGRGFNWLHRFFKQFTVQLGQHRAPLG